MSICLNCKQEIHFHPSLTLDDWPSPVTEEEKRTPGIIYSDAGYKEYKISGLCEACFDYITQEDECE